MAPAVPSSEWSQTATHVVMVVEARPVQGGRMEVAIGDGCNLAITSFEPGDGCNLAINLLELPLFADVTQKDEWLPASKGIKITLKKASEGMWPRLTSFKRDPGHVKVDWSKYKGDGDGDDKEESHDDYMRARYGVDSEWKGPGSGDAPPILGGRRPGEHYVQDELELREVDGYDDDAAALAEGTPGSDSDNEVTEVKESTSTRGGASDAAADVAEKRPRRCKTLRKWWLASVRGLELCAWMSPISVPASSYMLGMGNATTGIEAQIYPIVCLLVVLLGFFDLLIVLFGASRCEGPRIAAFSCFFKRSFICMSFLMFEAQFGGGRGVFSDARPGVTILMAAGWFVRKIRMYSEDVLDVLIVCALEKEGLPTRLMPRDPPSLGYFFVEAALEAMCVATYLYLLPPGTNLLGQETPVIVWALVLSATAFGDVVACLSLRSHARANKVEKPPQKETKVD